MAGDPGYRYNVNFAQSTPKNWVRRWCWRDGGSQLHNYTFTTNIGIAAVNPRWPLQPNDLAAIMVQLTGNESVTIITGITDYKEYAGITVNPQFAGQNEQVMEKNAKVMMPVGSEAVQVNDFLMPDVDSAFGTVSTDVIPQRQLKQWTFVAHTAVTCLVNLVAGYALGATQILVDTINIAFGLRPGQTIAITKAADGLVYYYLIRDVNYAVGAGLGADCLVTLAWPIVNTVVTNNDPITTAHLADAPVFFEFDSEFYENLHTIGKCVQLDQAAADADVLPVVAYVQAGIAATTVAVVPSGALALHTHPGGARGGVGLQLGDALVAGDAIHLNAWFYDRLIRTFTVGKCSRAQATLRTGLLEADFAETKVELKC